jgi:hypothetical protein
MRISGNYVDRLLSSVLPWTLLGTGIVFITRAGRGRLIVLLLTFIILTIVLWIIDSLIIAVKYKNPKTLHIDNGLYLGKSEIAVDDISQIAVFEDKRSKWSFQLIQIKMKDDRLFFVINKPNNFIDQLRNIPPLATVQVLCEAFPALADKVVYAGAR